MSIELGSTTIEFNKCTCILYNCVLPIIVLVSCT